MKKLSVAIVGNPAMHIPTMVGGLTRQGSHCIQYDEKGNGKLDMPPVDEFLEILSASGVKLWACKLAVDMFHISEKDLIEDLDGILTIGDFYNRADTEGTQLLFV